MATRLARAARANQALQVTGKGWQTTDGFEELLTIPASDMVVGHSYVAIVNCVAGHFIHANGAAKFQRAEVAPGLNKAADPFRGMEVLMVGGYAPWQTQFASNGSLTAGNQGLPIQWMGRFTAETGVDFRVRARVKVASQPSPGGSFLVDALSIVLWDTTEIAATAGTDYVYQVGGTFTVPWITSAPATLATMTHPTAGDWLLAASFQYTGRNFQSGDRVWLEDGSSILIGTRPYGFSEYGSNSGAANLAWLGTQYVRTMPATWTVRAKASSWASSGATSTVWGTILFGVRLHPDQALFFSPVGKSTSTNYWGPIYQGTPLEDDFTLPPYTDLWIFSNAIHEGAGTAKHQDIEVNGGIIDRAVVGVPGDLGPIQPGLPCVRSANAPLVAGDYKLRLWGSPTWITASKQVIQNGIDAQAWGFSLLADYVPPQPPIETKGAIVEIVPDRETGVGTGSLPPLPIAPSAALPVTVEAPIRELRIRRGDVISSSKVLQVRRIYALSWTGIPAVDAAGFANYLDTTILDAGQVFRWQPPRDLEERAWIIDQDGYNFTVNADGTASASLRALELVFTT